MTVMPGEARRARSAGERRPRAGRRLGAAASALALVIAGCSDSGTVAPDTTPRPQLTVSAASSMRAALTRCARDFSPGRLRLRFGTSDQLAARVREAPRPDVLAAADTAVPAALARQGLLEPPEGFAADELVVAVPKGAAGDVGQLADLAKPGVTVAIGTPAGTAGASARRALRRLDPSETRAILANVRVTAPDSAGVVARLEQG